MDRLIVLVPVYNDWVAFGLLLPRLDEALAGLHGPIRLVVVDDGSSEPPDAAFTSLRPQAVSAVTIIALRRNMGHQRAIAMGLAYVEANLPCERVVVMDGDGEDDPADVARLVDRLAAQERPAVVFAARTRRVEGLTFRLFYELYRAAHWVLTGIPVRVGNFSAVPATLLRRLVVVPELWNHYAASVFHARLPYESIPAARQPRLHGRSQMDFARLVGHGLSALSVHAELIGARLLVAGGLCAAFLVVASIGLGLFWLLHGAMAAPWIMMGGAVATILAGQAVGVLTMFALAILRGRSSSMFLPARDHVLFIEGVRTIEPDRR